ncbi:MAG: TonB-dependent receptor [Brevinematales bacterium]|nr:TonB-dependent receptor [Brevinematales bacterium]
MKSVNLIKLTYTTTLLFVTILITSISPFSYSEELNTNITQNATNIQKKASYESHKRTYKTLSPLVFEKTVVGTIWERDSTFSTIDVRKYKKKGDSSDITDYIQNIPDIQTPTHYGAEGSLITLFNPRGDKYNISINGLGISTMINSSYNANLLDALFFNGVDIYYGPSSSKYGSGNYGGVLNFNLLGDEDVSFIRVIRTLGASFETYYVMSDLSLVTDFGKFYLGVSYNRSENAFYYNISTLYTNQSSLEPTNYIRQGAHYTKYSILARYINNISGINLDIGFLGTLPTIDEPNQVQITSPLSYEKATSRNRFLLPYIKTRYSFDNTEIGLNLYYTEHYTTRKVEKPLNTSYGSLGSEISSSKFSTEIELKRKLLINEMNSILLGISLNFDYNSSKSESTNYSSFPTPSTNVGKTNATRNILGLYTEVNYLLSSLLQITASSRFEYMDGNIFELSPRLGILLKPTDFIGIRSSVWRAYRLPYFDDIYGGIVYGYGTVITNLTTEYVNGIDTSFILNYNTDTIGFYFSLTPYYQDTTNLIAYNNATLNTENIGKVYTRGINLNAKISFKDTLTSTISYTYNEAINGNAYEYIGWKNPVFLNYRPLNILYIDIVYERGYFGLGAYLDYIWYRYQYIYDSNFNIVGNKPIDDILTISIKHWARPKEWVELGVEWKRNLIGNEYIEGYPIPEEKINTYVIFEFSW